jgi:hypothetical protein
VCFEKKGNLTVAGFAASIDEMLIEAATVMPNHWAARN